MNQFMESTSENLSLLARRTESFSPSKRSSQRSSPPLNITPHVLFSPDSNRPTVPQAELETTSPTPSTSSRRRSPDSLSPTLPSPPSLNPPSQSSRQPDGGQLCTLASPTTISVPNHSIYDVLPLSPFVANSGQPLVHTPHDMILPPASAFSPSAYPIFTTVECTWQYILDRVVNPSFLWSSYAPRSLGDYEDIKSIWQVWDEGAYVKHVGHKPALRLIDARWGNLESQETHKRKLPSWRPRNDNKVCFFFFRSGYLIILY